MKNKTLANWLIASLVACTLGVMVEYDAPGFAAIALTFGGLGIWVFNIWAIIKLYKIKD